MEHGLMDPLLWEIPRLSVNLLGLFCINHPTRCNRTYPLNQPLSVDKVLL